MCDDGSQKTSVGRGSRKGAWETDCGKCHREAGSREKDDPSLCVKSEINPAPSMCGTPLWNHNRGFEYSVDHCP